MRISRRIAERPSETTYSSRKPPQGCRCKRDARMSARSAAQHHSANVVRRNGPVEELSRHLSCMAAEAISILPSLAAQTPSPVLPRAPSPHPNQPSSSPLPPSVIAPPAASLTLSASSTTYVDDLHCLIRLNLCFRQRCGRSRSIEHRWP